MRGVAGLLLVGSLVACSPSARRPTEIALAKPAGDAPPSNAPCEGERLLGASSAEEADVFGKRIEALCIQGASATARTTIEAKLGLAVGGVLTEQALRKGLEDVHATHIAADIAAYGRPAGQRAVVVVVVRERPRVGKVTLDGASAAAITVNRAPAATGLHPGEYYDPAYAHERAEALRRLYVEAGFEDARVRPETSTASDGVVDVRMVITEGLRAHVGAVTVVGARKSFAAAVLERAGLLDGAPISGGTLEGASGRVATYYRDQGFVEVRVDVVRGDKDGEGSVPIRFEIVEGDTFRVGKVALAKRPLDDASTKALLAKLKLRTGAVFSPSVMMEDADAITRFFAGRGRRVRVAPATTLDRKKKLSDVEYVVTER